MATTCIINTYTSIKNVHGRKKELKLSVVSRVSAQVAVLPRRMESAHSRVSTQARFAERNMASAHQSDRSPVLRTSLFLYFSIPVLEVVLKKENKVISSHRLQVIRCTRSRLEGRAIDIYFSGCGW